MRKETETDIVTMIIEDDMFKMIYKPLDLLDLDTAKLIVEKRIAFKEGKSYPSLFDIRAIKSTSKDARDYMANEGNQLVVASSLLVNSSVTKMIGNFFVSVSKPSNPTRLFTDEEKAIEWLEQYSAVEA